MTTSLFNLNGKVALISGAASGMGRASALALADHGADLLLADLNEAGLRETAELLKSTGRKVVTSRTNVSDEEEILQLFSVLDHEFGRVRFTCQHRR